MRTEDCRRWRTSLGAYVLGQLDERERAGLEAHLDGCAECRAEARSLGGVATLLPHADPERFEAPPQPPAGLGERIATAVAGERRREHRRRLRLGLALGTAAATACAVLALIVFNAGGGGAGGAPAQHVSFGKLPGGARIDAELVPQAFGTEIHMYVEGIPSGTLCQVFLHGPRGVRYSAGSFRYRWGENSPAVLGAALDLSRTRAIGVRAGNKTYIAPVGATTHEQEVTES